MKKFFYSVLAAATMLFATTSCSQEEEIVGGGTVDNGATQKVTFKVQMPDEGVTSRAIGPDVNVGGGNQVDKLIWALYEKGKDNARLDFGFGTPSEKVSGKQEFTAEISMVKGLTYNVLFFAYDEDGCVFQLNTEDPDLTALKLKDELLANQEGYDAFVKCHPYNTLDNERENTVTLKRPFAQINAATTVEDLDRAKKLQAVVTKSELIIEDVPTQYNVLTGEATETSDLTYASNAILTHYPAVGEDEHPNEDITVNKTGYKYLTMAYVLAGTTKDSKESMHDATFTFYRDNDENAIRTINIENLPIQRNYRTNVIGDLLTETESFKIVIDEEFDGNHNVNPNGEWPIDETGLNYFLSKAQNGDVIKLAGDITLTEALTIPEGLKVTLDLNGKTLSGNILAPDAELTIENGSLKNESSDASAIEIYDGELTLNNVDIESARHGVRVEGPATVEINGGTYKVVPTSNKTLHAVNVSDGGNVTINGGTFIGPKGIVADSGAAVNVQANSTVTINGGNFSGGKNNTLAASGTLTVNGGTFDQDPSAYVADGYKALEKGGLYYVVSEDTEAVIETADELVALGGTKINGTYVLAANIDMTDKEMKPIQLTSGNSNSLTFEGNGHTISNLTLVQDYQNGMYVAGLFNILHSGSELNVNNLKLENVTSTSNKYAAAVVAYNSTTLTINLNNVDVNVATITAETVAALVGYTTGAVNLTNCDVTNLTLTGQVEEDKVGALVGTANQAACAVTTTNCTNNTEYGDYGRVINGATWNGATIQKASTQEELNKAIASEGNIALTLDAGSYTMPSVSGKTLTIEGSEDVVITVNKPAFHGADLILNGVTIKTSGEHTGIQHVKTVTYNGAVIDGEMNLYGEKVVFNNCVFNLKKDEYIWTYGAKKAEFNNCVFNTAGKAILIYKDGGLIDTDVTVKGCIFNATESDKASAIANQFCAAVEIHNYQSNIELTTEGNKVDNNFSGVWRIKNYDTTHSCTITVNGVEYTSLAIEGKTMTIDASKNVTVVE